MRRSIFGLVLAAAVAATTTSAQQPAVAIDRPPVERDCSRWEAPRGTAFDRSEERDGPTAGAFADRAPNLEAAARVPLRRPVAIEALYCEQLNVKDKVDFLIRRTLR